LDLFSVETWHRFDQQHYNHTKKDHNRSTLKEGEENCIRAGTK
jgi:hypothetical protein